MFVFDGLKFEARFVKYCNFFWGVCEEYTVEREEAIEGESIRSQSLCGLLTG